MVHDPLTRSKYRRPDTQDRQHPYPGPLARGPARFAFPRRTPAVRPSNTNNISLGNTAAKNRPARRLKGASHVIAAGPPLVPGAGP